MQLRLLGVFSSFFPHFDLNEGEYGDHDQNCIGDSGCVPELRIVHERKIVDVLADGECCDTRSPIGDVTHLIKELQGSVCGHDGSQEDYRLEQGNRDLEELGTG
ncbi:hypothetical protein SDC9_182657 [bioreactor metagenome]|uniref:Uncharacterized protein n=1 Tax=bioreactor metagenome TaxID=1076179 RepID=A0A645H9V8_9ZZZZ